MLIRRETLDYLTALHSECARDGKDFYTELGKRSRRVAPWKQYDAFTNWEFIKSYLGLPYRRRANGHEARP